MVAASTKTIGTGISEYISTPCIIIGVSCNTKILMNDESKITIQPTSLARSDVDAHVVPTSDSWRSRMIEDRQGQFFLPKIFPIKITNLRSSFSIIHQGKMRISIACIFLAMLSQVMAQGSIEDAHSRRLATPKPGKPTKKPTTKKPSTTKPPSATKKPSTTKPPSATKKPSA